MVTMYTQGLKSFAHVLVRCFLLTGIRQLYQKKKSSTYIDIDKFKIFKDVSFNDPIPLKTKDMLDKTIK